MYIKHLNYYLKTKMALRFSKNKQVILNRLKFPIAYVALLG